MTKKAKVLDIVEAKYPSPDELVDITTRWQNKLRLADWKVYVKYGVPPEIKVGAYGQCTAENMYRRAYILILEPNHAACQGLPEFNIEQVIVHELLHLHFNQVAQSRKCFEEFAIEALAQAFVP